MYLFNKFQKIITILIVLITINLIPHEVRAYEGDVSQKYSIRVNRALNCVTVYKVDSQNGKEYPYKAFACSCGRQGHATPLGTYRIGERYDWRLMIDNTWAQYAVRFNGHILFHSVPYLTRNAGDLEPGQYNMLGELASLGCVRLCVADAKWIYDNCKPGTQVTVYADDKEAGPLGKPTPVKIDEKAEYKGWDPTDDNPDNPWHDTKAKYSYANKEEEKCTMYLMGPRFADSTNAKIVKRGSLILE